MANAVYVPRFGSQVRSGPTDYANLHPLGPVHTCSRRKRPDNRWSEKTKLSRFSHYATNARASHETRTRSRSRSPILQYNISSGSGSTARGAEETHSTSRWTVFDPASCEGGLSPPPPQPSPRQTGADTHKEKLKRAVLRTVSKMLRENGCTRQRLRALSGGSQSGRGRLTGATPPTRHAV